MIKILDINDEEILGYRFEGKIETSDIKRVWKNLEEKITNGGQVKIYAEAREWKDFSISKEAMIEDFKLWLRHPGIISRIEKAAFVTDETWLKRIFDVECSLIPTLTGETFPLEKRKQALEWLKSDRTELGEVNIKWVELVELGLLRSTAGIGFGLLTADLFSRKTRKTVGWSLFLGSFAIGIPIGINFLNKNKIRIKD